MLFKMQLKRLSEVLQFRQRAAKCRCTSRAKGALTIITHTHIVDSIKFPETHSKVMQQFPYPTPRYVVVPQVSYYTYDDNDNAACFDRVLFILFCFVLPAR